MTRQRVPNAELYRDTARQNLLTNGGFEIWQRGNGPFTLYNNFTADRWNNLLVGTDGLSIAKNTANQDAGSNACAACTFTLGNGAGNSALQQLLKASDGYVLAGKTVTFSCRVRTSTANAVRLAIVDVTNSTFAGTSGYHSGGGSYETLTVTATFVSNCVAVAIDVLFAASCTAYVDNAMLVIGNVAADYAPLHPADDLARCQRYYEVTGGPGAGDFILRSVAVLAAMPIDGSFTFRVAKAVSPTMTKVGTWNVANCAQPAIPTTSISGFRMEITTTAGGNADTYALNAAAGCCVTAEANP